MAEKWFGDIPPGEKYVENFRRNRSKQRLHVLKLKRRCPWMLCINAGIWLPDSIKDITLQISLRKFLVGVHLRGCFKVWLKNNNFSAISNVLILEVLMRGFFL